VLEESRKGEYWRLRGHFWNQCAKVDLEFPEAIWRLTEEKTGMIARYCLRIPLMCVQPERIDWIVYGFLTLKTWPSFRVFRALFCHGFSREF